MKLSPQELKNNNYTLESKFSHDDLLPFLKPYFRKWNIFSISFHVLCLVFGIIVFYILFKTSGPLISKKLAKLTYFSFGIVGSFLLIPIHEYIHVLAYKYVGAKSTSLAANFKKFYFMALAHEFVANKKEFTIVALAPIVIISILHFAALAFSSSSISICISVSLFFHAMMCSGDFALLSYFQENKNRQLLTYDDVVNKITYFYKKVD